MKFAVLVKVMYRVCLSVSVFVSVYATHSGETHPYGWQGNTTLRGSHHCDNMAYTVKDALHQ